MVQGQDKGRSGGLDSAVGASGKAGVVGTANDLGGRRQLADELERFVLRAVVDKDELPRFGHREDQALDGLEGHIPQAAGDHNDVYTGLHIASYKTIICSR